jgi:hypothetical protein
MYFSQNKFHIISEKDTKTSPYFLKSKCYTHFVDKRDEFYYLN